MTVELGRLQPVPARQIWPHEALDLTPWLLVNVDVLSELLGMDLALDRAEHPVGGFSLDLIGRDLSTDQKVIVENQLEMSDHTHLGQILTYAAGTDPSTIIWIATGFREEHRAALDWLNERTDENTRFFGIEIRVVRIGDSPAAPAFELIAQPNDWGKRVRTTTAASGELSGLRAQYSDFWEQLLDRIHAADLGWTRSRRSSTTNWVDLALEPGVVIDTTFSRDGLSAWIYFNASDPTVNSSRYSQLLGLRAEFETAFGGAAIWDEMPKAKAARVGVLSPFTTVTATDQWPQMIDWIMDAQTRLRRTYALLATPPAGEGEPAQP